MSSSSSTSSSVSSFDSYIEIMARGSGEEEEYKSDIDDNIYYMPTRHLSFELERRDITDPIDIYNNETTSETSTDIGTELYTDQLSAIEMEMNDLLQREYLFLESEKEDKHYYIGLHVILKNDYSSESVDPYEMLLNCCISPTSFFDFSLKTVERYLYNYSVFYFNYYNSKRNVEILQLHFDKDTGAYNVVIKTFWLRVFQRWWKRECSRRKTIMKHRMKLSSMRYFEIHGRYPIMN